MTRQPVDEGGQSSATRDVTGPLVIIFTLMSYGRGPPDVRTPG